MCTSGLIAPAYQFDFSLTGVATIQARDKRSGGRGANCDKEERDGNATGIGGVTKVRERGERKKEGIGRKAI